MFVYMYIYIYIYIYIYKINPSLIVNAYIVQNTVFLL